MQRELIETNPILKMTFEFSLKTIEYCEKLEAEKKYIVAKQLLRSATSIGANSIEAQNPSSKPDFIYKIKLAAREADETQYWLLLCDYSKTYPDCKELLAKLEEIQKVLNKILYTAKKKNPISFLFSYFIF